MASSNTTPPPSVALFSFLNLLASSLAVGTRGWVNAFIAFRTRYAQDGAALDR